MAFTLENMRSMKLGRPLGDRSGGEPRPQYVESRFSGRSLTDCRDALRGVRDVWDGDGDATEARGISDLLDDSGELTEQVDGLFDAAEARLGEVPETLEDAVVGDPAPAVAAQDALRDLQIGIQIDLAQALGVTITFNDNDGD
jgi:predicted lipoprotein